MDIRNNIFSNTQTGLAGSKYVNVVAIAAFPWGSNGNNYNANTAINIIGWQTTDKTTLAAWQATTLQDGASLAAVPNFVSTTDPHLTAVASQLESTGLAGTGVTLDIDGQTMARWVAQRLLISERTNSPARRSIWYRWGDHLHSSCTRMHCRSAHVERDHHRCFWCSNRWSRPPGAVLGTNQCRVYTRVTATSLGAGVYQFSFGAGAVTSDVVGYYIVAQDGAGTPKRGLEPERGSQWLHCKPTCGWHTAHYSEQLCQMPKLKCQMMISKKQSSTK